MNSNALALDKLADLIDLAAKANTDFEKATVFGATAALVQDLESELGDGSGYASEKLEVLRWNISSLVGYDTGYRKSDLALKADALGALHVLRDRLLKE